MKKPRFWTGSTITQLQPNQVFVFGSNPQGRHGAGAAKAALQFGAQYGVGRGLVGQTYALVTKNLKAGFTEKSTGITYSQEGYQSVSLAQIAQNVDELYETARARPDLLFIVTYKNETTPQGMPKKSLNGYTGEQMWDVFTINKTVPTNIVFHESFKPLYAARWTTQNGATDTTPPSSPKP